MIVVMENHACGRIQEQPGGSFAVIVKVKHAEHGAGFDVGGIATDPPEFPIVLDETQDGRLVGHAVVDEVLFCVGRNNEQRLAGAVTATAGGAHRGSHAAGSGSSDGVVIGAIGLVDD